VNNLKPFAQLISEKQPVNLFDFVLFISLGLVADKNSKKNLKSFKPL
jgi:hypothetical protein